MPERSAGSRPITLEGAVDLHCHFGPEQLTAGIVHAPHKVDPIEAAREARDAGMRAIVLKAHEFASTMAAYLTNQVVPEVDAIASVCLDHPMGGLNPYAAEAALAGGAKVVWLPTLSAEGSSPAVLKAAFGLDEGLRTCDADGELLPEVREILALVEQYDAVLATGHISKEEHFAVARAWDRPNRLLVTHAMQETAGPALTVQECLELAGLGAAIEFSAHSCAGQPAQFARVLDAIGLIGPERVALSSDYGWTTNAPAPVDGMTSWVNELWESGVPEEALRVMTATVPERLLGYR